MKLFKLFATVLLLAVIVLFVKQNLATFRTVLPFTLDLYIREEVHWSHELLTLLALSGILGLILGLGLMAKPYFNMRRALSRQTVTEEKPVKRSLIAKGRTAKTEATEKGAAEQKAPEKTPETPPQQEAPTAEKV